MKYNVLVTLYDGDIKDTFLPREVLDYLEENFNVKYNTLGRNFKPDELKENLKDIDLVLTGWGVPSFGDDMLEGNDRLKMIASTGGSVADIVDAGVYAKGIKVCSGNYYYAESVAEGTAAYIMACLRNIPDDVARLREGAWQSPDLQPTQGLLDQEIGIISCGAISKILMQMLQVFRCSFKVYSAHPIDPEFLKSVNAKQVSLEEVLKTCHIVSLHSSLNEKTRGMLGRAEFEMMQEDSVFINTARGAIIRQDEMTEVLASRPKMRAVLDVFDSEPLRVDSPLRQLPNVYCIPHRGGPTIDRRKYIGMAMVRELLHFVNGEPLEHEIAQEVAARMTSHKRKSV